MKKYLFAIIALVSAVTGFAQSASNTFAKAKVYNDSAVNVFYHSNGDISKLNEEIRLEDLAIGINKLYFDAWMSKMNFYGHFDQFDKALKTAKEMEKVFPKDSQPFLCTGILQYITGHKADATASFNSTLKIYNTLISTNKNAGIIKSALIKKGILLILMDKEAEGKKILTDIYNKEKDDYNKSYLAFYINNHKDAIMSDMVPGK